MGKRAESGFYVEWETFPVRHFKIVIAVLGAAAISIISWYWLRTSEPPKPIVPRVKSVARFVALEGKVVVKSRNEYEWTQASLMASLFEGTKVHTGPDASAKIQYLNGTYIVVQPNSMILIPATGTEEAKLSPSVNIVRGITEFDTGESDSSVVLSSKRIPILILEPGSVGLVSSGDQGDSAIFDKGKGIATDEQGHEILVETQEKLEINKSGVAVKTKLPIPPAPYSPTSGQLFAFHEDPPWTVELRWEKVSHINGFQVQVSTTDLFTKIVAQKNNLSRNSIETKIPGDYKQQFFWRVRSIDENNNRSSWSKIMQFVVQPPGLRPKLNLVTPPPFLKVSSITPFLPWVHVRGKTDKNVYLTLNGKRIEVKDDGSFASTYLLEHAGLNDLVFVAEDAEGVQTSITQRVENK